ncbi:hypothetical protein TNIN_484591 [Trichonephila inaurata madagascariensis]|uniref:BTB domain-containing protein n=1 Tax=Trichonephila inaurata madagascariensis TaxID=2747483 RepID=A0A8X7C617_9ARAC|nr:hypothetical protein TNIN_195261 [Trichonephila inaurata madagascariensis]GFY71814.1 hypothetical protein TNIN_484591 [Trichonephila inaurata madagascariensis]
MLQSLPNTRFKHVITWELKDFLQCPFRFIEGISSQPIRIKCLALTIWRLDIYICKKEMISCVIRRVDDNKTIDVVDLDYNICFVGKNDMEYFLNTGRFTATASEPSFPPFQFTSLNSLQNYHLRDDALVIRGNLTFTINRENILSRVCNKHLISLSWDISRLLENGLFSDFTLKTEETDIKVHKCILSILWPYAIDSTIEMSDMSPEVLDIILRCVYLQAEIRSPPQLHSDLLISARTCQLPDLWSSLRNYPVECHIVTPMNRETLIFNYDLTRIARWPDSFPTHVRILPLAELIASDLMVTFSLSRDSEGRKYLGISFQFSGFSKYRPIFMVCKMSVINRVDQSINPLEFQTTFVRDEEWNSPPYFKEEIYPSTFARQFKRLRCELSMCDGTDAVNVEYISSRYAVNRPELLINDLSKQSDLLYYLLRNPSYSDVDLLVGGKIIKAHKAIISARSSWFRNYLINIINSTTEHCTIPLPNFNENIVKLILLYIYSGKIGIINKETIPELLSAAEFFQLFLLKAHIRELPLV